MYHQFNIQQFYVLPIQCIYVFCLDLRTNRDYFPMQHSPVNCVTDVGSFTVRYGLIRYMLPVLILLPNPCRLLITKDRLVLFLQLIRVFLGQMSLGVIFLPALQFPLSVLSPSLPHSSSFTLFSYQKDSSWKSGKHPYKILFLKRGALVMKNLYLVVYSVKNKSAQIWRRSGILEDLSVFLFVEFASRLQTPTVDSRIM